MSNSISSYIPTGNATGTRNRDQLSFPLTAIPQALTVYVKMRVMQPLPTVNVRLVELGASGSGAPRLVIYISTAGILHVVFQSTTNVDNSAGAAVAVGDIVEARATLTVAGVPTLAVTKNGGTEAVGGSGAAQPLPTAWVASAALWVNSIATSNTNIAQYLAICLARGVLSLDAMRRYAGTHTRNG